MSDRHARYGAATGILFVLFVIVGFLVTPNPPAADASAAEVFEYVSDKQDTLHAVQLIFAVAGFFFIWFIGTLRHSLGRGRGRRRAPREHRLRRRPDRDRDPDGRLRAGGDRGASPGRNGPELTHALIDASCRPGGRRPRRRGLLRRQRPQHPPLRLPAGLARLARAGHRALQPDRDQRRLHRQRRLRRRRRARLLHRLRACS